MQSSGRNMVQLAGRITREPFYNGNPDIIHFGIVCPEALGLMMDCTIYKKSFAASDAAYMPLLTRGGRIFIKGYLEGCNYTSRSGKKIYKAVLVCEKIRPDDSHAPKKEKAQVKRFIPEGFHVI